MTHSNVCTSDPRRRVPEELAMSQLMGLAVFGEKVAARTYALMGELEPRYAELMRKFASMEGKHGAWFAQAARENGWNLDREFAKRELGYLVDQVHEYHAARDFDALAVLQGFIVECLAISTYEPFIDISRGYAGLEGMLRQALADERYHVSWVTRYLGLRFFDDAESFMLLAERVNARGVDCVGGTLMNITDCLTTVGLRGPDCAAAMADTYSALLTDVGTDEKSATRSVVALFHPVMRKYRHGERTK